jgi:DNA-binding helix-hairpin-helix protein with protein kinase domain
MKTLYTGKGAAVRIGRELGKGGEGSVYELVNNQHFVAKLYHCTPDATKQRSSDSWRRLPMHSC